MDAGNPIVELFRAELAGHCAVLEDVLTPPYDARAVSESLTSLRSGAAMLGFPRIASLFSRLLRYFPSADPSKRADPVAVRIIEYALSLRSDTAGGLLEKIESTRAIAEELDRMELDVPQAPPPEAEVSGMGKDGGGVIRPDMDDALKPLFFAEVENAVATLESGLVELEGDFGNLSKTGLLMRASHALKGASKVVGLDCIVKLAHAMENRFVAAQNGETVFSSTDIDLLLECVDFLKNLLSSSFAEVDSDFAASLCRALDAAEPAPLVSARTPAQNSASPPASDSSVRISAKNLNSIMELAAESLVENRSLESFRQMLSGLKNSLDRLSLRFEDALNSDEASKIGEYLLSRLEQLRADAREGMESLRSLIGRFSEFSRRNAALSEKLYSEVLLGRLRPLSDGLKGLPRMVRDLARAASKRIALEIEGADVSVDRDVLEKLSPSVTQILRNSCDHGIEPPEERIRNGKPPTGTIRIKAWHSAGMLMLEISDDGRGFDEEKIRRRIVELSLVPREMLEKMSRREIFEFPFLPGFSTRSEVSELSGRGVGLDIVRSMLREVEGKISVRSERGKGTSMTMSLPVARSVVKALVVVVDSQPYAFPLALVHRVLKVDPSGITAVGSKKYFEFDDRRAEAVDSSRILGFGEGSFPSPDGIHLVVVSSHGRYYGFEVEGPPRESELVVRRVDKLVGKIPCVSAASIDEDGEPVLIFDIDDLLMAAEKNNSPAAEPPGVPPSSGRGRVLVVDDSETVRRTQRRILERAGYFVDAAVDGMDGWNMFRLSNYDLVVSDVDMPRMDGFSLVEKIRSRNKKIPVVMVSYKDRPEDKNRGLASGADAYLTKGSFQDDSFLETVRSLLS